MLTCQGHTDNDRSELAPRFSWPVLSLVTTTTMATTTTVIIATTDQTVWQTLCLWFSHWILLESVLLCSLFYMRGHRSLSQPEIDRTEPSQFSLSSVHLTFILVCHFHIIREISSNLVPPLLEASQLTPTQNRDLAWLLPCKHIKFLNIEICLYL